MKDWLYELLPRDLEGKPVVAKNASLHLPFLK